jgi:ribosomal protein S18 acetylase RimI-like enzyme
MNTQYSIQNRIVSLRPARAEDEIFLYQVYASTRATEMALVDWTPEQKETFLQMQSTAQLQYYRLTYPQAQYQIIARENTSIGRMIVDRSENPVLLMDIALLPEYQNNGLGTALIRDLMAEAARKNWGLRLHVETFNPAMRLYHRLGFVKTSEVGVYYEMTWYPQSH